MIARIVVGLLLLWATLSGCLPTDEVFTTEAVSLRFSTDTVFFDTLFTNELSVTKRLKVYNPAREAVLIESVWLEEGAASPYVLKVNGQTGKNLGPVELLGGDSLLVLLEAVLPRTAQTTPYRAFDAVVTTNNSLSQRVPVVGYGQNANVISGLQVVCNEIWTNELPYVIEDTLLVDTLCTLTIEKGTRLYFKPGAYLFVKGTLIAKGDSAETDQILLRNFRLDAAFDQPGQWGGISFLPGSKNNQLEYCHIRNAITGIRLGTPDEDTTPDLMLEKCKLINHYTAGILAFTSDLEATNTLVANCLGPAVAGLAGGNYTFTHCTFANYFRGSVSRELPTALFTDVYQVQNENGEIITFTEPLNLRLQNSIVWGNLFNEDEIAFELNPSQNNTLELAGNLLRTADPQLGQDNITSQERNFPDFQQIEEENFRPGENSPGRNAGLPLGIPKDLSGALRDAQPDIGALEYLPTEED